MAPRSPPSSGSSVAMPAALFTMQRKVPTVLRPSTYSKSEILKGMISPVFLSRPIVLPPRPPPAQFTRQRSCPCAARLFETSIDGRFVHHIDLAVKRAKLLRNPLAILLVQIED